MDDRPGPTTLVTDAVGVCTCGVPVCCSTSDEDAVVGIRNVTTSSGGIDAAATSLRHDGAAEEDDRLLDPVDRRFFALLTTLRLPLNVLAIVGGGSG